jgi:ElaB/YqjD/DUF883 family membrane-anchored ribosome-binding protein
MAADVDMDIKELRTEFVQLRKDFAKLTHTLEETARHGAAEARARVSDTVGGLRQDADKAARLVTDEISKNPVTGALAAFGIGVVLGLLLGPRR